MSCNSEGIEISEKILKNGGIVIFPTDTVYGIGCDPYNKRAVDLIYQIKKRQPSKLFPILGYSVERLSSVAVFDEIILKLAEKFWPGPLTMILPLKDSKLQRTLNVEKKIAVRIPNHKCTLSLLKKCGLIVGTSANTSGTTPYVDPQQIIKNLDGYDVLIDDGKISNRGESTIIEIKDNLPQIIREGILSQKEILELF